MFILWDKDIRWKWSSDREFSICSCSHKIFRFPLNFPFIHKFSQDRSKSAFLTLLRRKFINNSKSLFVEKFFLHFKFHRFFAFVAEEKKNRISEMEYSWKILHSWLCCLNMQCLRVPLHLSIFLFSPFSVHPICASENKSYRMRFLLEAGLFFFFSFRVYRRFKRKFEKENTYKLTRAFVR